MSGDLTNEARVARIKAVLSATGGHDYLDPGTGVRDLIADALHLARATSQDPAREHDAGLEHWLAEAMEEHSAPESALAAAPLDVWQTVFESCVEEGQVWRPEFALTVVNGQYRIRDERDQSTRGELVPTIEAAIDYVLDSYEFEPARVFGHVGNTDQALNILAVIDKVAAQHTQNL